MPTLFTYIIPIDDGAAPNPFDGICTLAICKPAIRRTARPGDWVVGLGSINAPSGDLSGHVVYAMRVDERYTLAEYDRLAPAHWPLRIPDITSPNIDRRLGDCIYDYSSGDPQQRPGVHGPENVTTDLGGVNALVSEHFYYFGNSARALPPGRLRNIVHQGRGHRSKANSDYVQDFVDWIGGLGLSTGKHGEPDFKIVDWRSEGGCGACLGRKEDDEKDIECS